MTCTASLLFGLALLAPHQDLEASLEAVSASSIESDVRFLASEALGGRGTPSPGLEVSALYIKARLERLGYRPGSADGFFHEYPLIMQRVDPAASHVEIKSAKGTERLEFGVDYFFRSAELIALDLSAEVVSIGAGGPDELASCELNGRWALLLDQGRFTKHVVEAVREAGAIGVVLVAGEQYRRKPYSERFGPTVRGMTAGRVMKVAHAEALSSSSLPRIWLSETGVGNLLGLSENSDKVLPAPGELLGVTLREVRVPDGGRILVKNVCGFLPGSDSELAKETVIVSAHYDHLGTRSGRLHPGADDNASGTAGLLALAAALKERGSLQRSVLLLWVSGEEKGLWGSEAWAEEAWLPDQAHVVLNINLDMIGRTAARELYVTPSRAHSKFNPVAELVYELAEKEGFDEPQAQDEYWRRSDHFSFSSELGVPVVYLSSGDHDDYHKASDTADKIDEGKIARTVRLVLRMLDRLQDAEF